jgi:hypothetical protein
VREGDLGRATGWRGKEEELSMIQGGSKEITESDDVEDV